jgi:lipopolysaccharide export system ATP-binding protein
MLLSAENLYKIYSRKKVVNNVSIYVNQGEIVGLLGPNGAGKTTTFYMLVGQIAVDSGKIFLDDLDITKYPIWDRAKNGIGYLPQESSIFKDLSVEDNINFSLELMSYSRRQKQDKLEQLLNEFNVQHIRKNLGRMLSGGERRRVELARLLAINPKFVLLDEPFAGVDPIAIKDIQNLINTLKKKNIGVLITDHNVDETLTITDRAYLMANGKILKSGTTEDLINDENVRSVYLGKNFTLKNDF